MSKEQPPKKPEKCTDVNKLRANVGVLSSVKEPPPLTVRKGCFDIRKTFWLSDKESMCMC